MAEDGMLMNFSLGDGSLNTPQVFKGGRWKDRLKAKKTAQHRRPRQNHDGASFSSSSAAVNDPNTIDAAPERPQKRQKLDSNHDSHAKPSKPRQEVISSLFSYNPSSTIPKELSSKEATVSAKPSNAPLLDGLDTFTTLGLSTTLATHLLTKLNLKAPTAIQKSTITQLIKEDSDAFIQAETGSGKTLAYLLPIVQRIMELSKKQEKPTDEGEGAKVHRDSGLFAIILAPTRELCKQISIVLDSLLRCAHWVVAGTVIGGEKKKSEKARLRKGLNILVATPGRLADHLSNTEVLDVSNVRWLVLDEGDRLMELGFEEEIRGIVAKLEDQTRISKRKNMPGLPNRRTTVLCSATMKMNVQRLGEISLKDAILIKADPTIETLSDDSKPAQETAFSAPAQLKQSYILAPAKQRLVTLAALLKRTFARKGSVMKAIVFLSCADSVDFHFALFGRQPNVKEGAETNDGEDSSDTDTEDMAAAPSPSKPAPVPLTTTSSTPVLTTSSNPNVTLYKLHGSLPQSTRTATLASFTRSVNPSILLCTDVASRGLDLPNIDLVIEYDPSFSADDHLHRVGRTARAGRDGRAVIFLMPGPEENYVEILKAGYKDGVGNSVTGSGAEEILTKGFGRDSTGGTSVPRSQARHWEEVATEWQLDAERWIIEDKRAGEMARKAFISHVRAYATHVAKERGMFDVKALHLGHLAKAFALRERPGSFGRGVEGGSKVGRRMQRREPGKGNDVGAGKGEDEGALAVTDKQDAARRMRKALDAQMRGASEFNIG
ncbi:ATP-dependent RNA helicase dbp7 [Trapelia coarctata]|nr:ATP-dependent RNA helicase dbp7 [Trapelia coarctata]